MPDRRLPAFGFTSVCPTGRAVLRNLKLSMLCRPTSCGLPMAGRWGQAHPPASEMCTKQPVGPEPSAAPHCCRCARTTQKLSAIKLS